MLETIRGWKGWKQLEVGNSQRLERLETIRGWKGWKQSESGKVINNQR